MKFVLSQGLIFVFEFPESTSKNLKKMRVVDISSTAAIFSLYDDRH